MKRRNFIKWGGAAISSTMVSNRTFAAFNPQILNSCAGINDRVLVLIRLSGGNDGINTIVPINQYNTYATMRPTIKIPDTGTGSFINLDSTLSLQNQVGLNPVMTDMKSMYDDGLMSVIQGVAYNYQNRSHFKSTDLWMSGGDGTAANNVLKSGWVARYLENTYPGAAGNTNLFDSPLALQLGEKKPAMLFHSEHTHGISTNMAGQDVSGFYSVVSGVGGAPVVNAPASDHGDLLSYISDIEQNANVYSQRVSTAFDNGSNVGTYPQYDLADQLKTVAKLISGGLKTKVFLVSLGGFDTHNAQIDITQGVTEGRHAVLLKTLSESVKAFFSDLKSQGLDELVMAASFSEFGRKVQENGNNGTDHGGMAPMFVFGKGLSGGVEGGNVDLSEATQSNNYQIQTQQFDYKDVFATLLQDWLGASDDIVDKALFDNNTPGSSYTDSKLNNLINAQYKVDPSCYISSLISNTQVPPLQQTLVYPNPAKGMTNIQFTQSFSGRLLLTGIDGRVLKSTRISSALQHTLHLNGLAPGNYILNFQGDNKQQFTQKLTVIQ